MTRGPLFHVSGNKFTIGRHQYILACEIPILLEDVIEYEFLASDDYYLNKLVDIHRAPYSQPVAMHLYKDQLGFSRVSDLKTFEEASAIMEPLSETPEAIVWLNFEHLHRLWRWTGQFHVTPHIELDPLVLAQDYFLKPEAFPARWEDLRIYRHIKDLTCDVGSIVKEERIAQTYSTTELSGCEKIDKLIHRDSDTGNVSLAWAHDLEQEFYARFPPGTATFWDSASDANVPPGGTVYLNAHLLSVKHDFAPAEHTHFVGDLDSAMDLFVAQKDLPVTAMRRQAWRHVKRIAHPIKDMHSLIIKGRKPGQVALLREASNKLRADFIRSLPADSDVLCVCLCADPAIWSSLATARPTRFLLCAGRLIGVKWAYGRQTFWDNGVELRNEMHGLPLNVVGPAMLPSLPSDTFDFVIVASHPGVNKRWHREAMRVGRGGTTIFFGAI